MQSFKKTAGDTFFESQCSFSSLSFFSFFFAPFLHHIFLALESYVIVSPFCEVSLMLLFPPFLFFSSFFCLTYSAFVKTRSLFLYKIGIVQWVSRRLITTAINYLSFNLLDLPGPADDRLLPFFFFFMSEFFIFSTLLSRGLLYSQLIVLCLYFFSFLQHWPERSAVDLLTQTFFKELRELNYRRC